MTSTELQQYVDEPAVGLEVWAGDRPSSIERSLEIVPKALALAEALGRANFVPEQYRGKPNEIVACLLYAHELDIGAMTALQVIYVVNGRPSLSAEIMRALIRRAGHELWFEEVTSTRVTCCARRAGAPAEQVARVSWTMDDAQRAGLATKEVWRKFPRAMLKARASSELARDEFPEVLRGMSYSTEEIRDGSVPSDDDWQLEDAPEIGRGSDPSAPEDAPEPVVPTSSRKAPTKKTAPARPTKRAASKRKAPAPVVEPADQPALPGEDEAPSMAPAAKPEAEPEPSLVDEKTDEPEPAADEVAERRAETAKRRAQMIAIRCGEVLGPVDELRHALIDIVTDGRVQSATKVTSEETDALLAALQRIADGEQVLDFSEGEGYQLVDVAELLEGDGLPDEPEFDVDGDGNDEPEPEDVERDPGDASPTAAATGKPVDGDGWREFLKANELRVPHAIREAVENANAMNVEPAPTTLDELADNPEIAGLVYEWALEQIAGKS